MKELEAAKEYLSRLDEKYYREGDRLLKELVERVEG